MKITIINRFTKKTIVEGEFESLKKAVEENKGGLSRAYLSGADLYGANLSGANLHGADLSRANIKSTQKDELLKSLRIVVGE